MPLQENLFAHIPDQLPEELIEPIMHSDHVRVERIVSLGHTSPEGFWYEQETDEWVLVLTGEARLLIEGTPEEHHLKRGDYIHLPAGVRHRVTWTDPGRLTVWLAIHFTK